MYDISTLGVPVEPEVYITIAVSWGVGAVKEGLSLVPIRSDERKLAPYRIKRKIRNQNMQDETIDI